MSEETESTKNCPDGDPSAHSMEVIIRRLFDLGESVDKFLTTIPVELLGAVIYKKCEEMADGNEYSVLIEAHRIIVGGYKHNPSDKAFSQSSIKH